MPKKLAKIIFIVVILGLSMSLGSLALAAQQTPPSSCLEDYTVQAGDWISTIAEKYYGNVLAYPAIINATNVAAAEVARYLSINNPNLIEAGQVLCIPAVEEVQALLNGQQLPQNPAPLMPEDKMLIIVGNRTLANTPTTLTLSGGQFGGGEVFTLEAAQEIRLELEPGEYGATWTSPEGTTFGRTFKAVAGRVAIGWIVPEENYVFTEIQRGRPGEDDPAQAVLGQLTMPSVMTTTTPYTAAEGKALLVAGNRGFADIPSTLTLSGGQFGGGKEFSINPGQELILALEPGDYRANWSAPKGEAGPFTLAGEFTAVAGRIGILWIVPEVSRAFFQRPGEPGQEIK
jgi:LysM repeat protein